MTHPLDNPQGEFLVLDNAQGQTSVWPAPLNVPPGWSVVSGIASLEECRAFIESRVQAAQAIAQAATLAAAQALV